MTPADLIECLGWVPLTRYCQVTGENPSTLHMRRRNSVWSEGVEIATPIGGCTHVNIHAVRRWCERKGKPVKDVPALLIAQMQREREKGLETEGLAQDPAQVALSEGWRP